MTVSNQLAEKLFWELNFIVPTQLNPAGETLNHKTLKWQVKHVTDMEKSLTFHIQL